MRIYALKNKEIENSASGAAFPTIINAVKQIEREMPVVYGATFDENFKVVHERGVTEQEYLRFRGSKYVQSYLGDTFYQALEDLSNGRVVLFTGTPCQIHGLKKFLEKNEINTSRLYLIDIICHGTPNPDLWMDFVKWLEDKEGSKLKSFNFRYHLAKWKVYPVMAEFENGKKIVNTHEVRLYTKLFLRNLIMRECCYTCKYAMQSRYSDITIGDFWGVEKVMPHFPEKKSVSQMLINTIKGETVLKAIEQLEDINLVVEQCYSNEYLKYQHNLNGPTKKRECVEQLRNDYKEHGIEFVLKHYAGYNLKGKLTHIIERILGEIGIKNS